MIGRLLVAVVLMQLFLVQASYAEEPMVCWEKDFPTNQNGVLKAFEGPTQKESEVAAKRVFSVLSIALFGFFIIFILFAFFYEPKKGIAKPTPLRGIRKEDSPSSQHKGKPESTRWEISE